MTFVVEQLPWMRKAACRDKPTEMFFDDIDSAHSAERRLDALHKARAVCALCPVRTECAEQALHEESPGLGSRYGVRGWLTPEQRETVYRRGGLRGRDPMKVARGRDGTRKLPPIPDDGVVWSRHDTTLARRLVAWMHEQLSYGEKLPPEPVLADLLGCNAVRLKRVLDELVADRTIDFVGKGKTVRTRRYVYKRRTHAVDSWTPRHERGTHNPQDTRKVTT